MGGGGLMSGEECVSVHEENETKSKDPKQSTEEKRKSKRIEKLVKRINLLQKKSDKIPVKRAKFEREANEIKNKHKRQEVVLRRRIAANQEKKLNLLKTRKLREEQGEEAVPKGKN